VGPPEDYTSLDLFHRNGNPTVASTWFQPRNVIGFSQAVHRAKSRGLLQTTWAGFSLDEESFKREMHQYYVHVLAGEAAWNADRQVDMDLLDAADAFFDMMDMSPPQHDCQQGWIADLSSAANMSLKANAPCSWFGLGPQHDLSNVPTGNEQRWRGLRINVLAHDNYNAIGLAGKRCPPEMSLPKSVTLHLNQSANALVMIVCTDIPCEVGTLVATVELKLGDDSRWKLDLIYGKNVFAYTDLTPTPQAPAIWRGMTPSESEIALRATVWNLNVPNAQIKSLTLRTSDSSASPILAHLSGYVKHR